MLCRFFSNTCKITQLSAPFSRLLVPEVSKSSVSVSIIRSGEEEAQLGRPATFALRHSLYCSRIPKDTSSKNDTQSQIVKSVHFLPVITSCISTRSEVVPNLGTIDARSNGQCKKCDHCRSLTITTMVCSGHLAQDIFSSICW